MSNISREIMIYGTLHTVEPSYCKPSWAHSNWALDCWREFTALSEEDKHIFKQIKPVDVKNLLLKLMRERQ